MWHLLLKEMLLKSVSVSTVNDSIHSSITYRYTAMTSYSSIFVYSVQYSVYSDEENVLIISMHINDINV